MTGHTTSPNPETRELTARLERAVTALEEFLAAESRHVDFPPPGARDGRRR